MDKFLLAANNTLSSYMFLGLMLLVLYMVMIMPQRKQQKKDIQMRSSLDIGDEVLTQGGILGRIVSMREDTIVIETGSDRVKIRIVKNAVIQNTTSKPAAKKEGAK
jgi:preprotein translocase subunit YajC